MKLSKRSEYGIRALIYLASRPEDNGVVQIKEIAQAENIPLKFLEQILLSLKNAGLVNSRMGSGGGYYLSKPANQIMLGQIIRFLDGPLAPVRCVSQVAYESCSSCPNEAACGLRPVMLEVRNAIAGILDHTSLQDVVQRAEKLES